MGGGVVPPRRHGSLWVSVDAAGRGQDLGKFVKIAAAMTHSDRYVAGYR